MIMCLWVAQGHTIDGWWGYNLDLESLYAVFQFPNHLLFPLSVPPHYNAHLETSLWLTAWAMKSVFLVSHLKHHTS